MVKLELLVVKGSDHGFSQPVSDRRFWTKSPPDSLVVVVELSDLGGHLSDLPSLQAVPGIQNLPEDTESNPSGRVQTLGWPSLSR